MRVKRMAARRISMIDQNLDENCNVPIAGSVASEQHLHGDPAIKVSSGQENLLK